MKFPKNKLPVHANNTENSKWFHNSRQIQNQQVICPSVQKRREDLIKIDNSPNVYEMVYRFLNIARSFTLAYVTQQPQCTIHGKLGRAWL
jgi:hypothetical protein